MSSTRIFQALRIVLAVGMIFFITTLFDGGSQSESSAAFETVQAAVIQGVDMTNMQQAENRMLKRLYGLSSGDYEGIVLYYPTTNMGAEEILLVKLADTDQADTVTAAIDSRLATQKKSFDGYGTDQTDLLTNYSIIDVQGNYILFVVNYDCDGIDAAFQGSL